MTPWKRVTAVARTLVIVISAVALIILRWRIVLATIRSGRGSRR